MKKDSDSGDYFMFGPYFKFAFWPSECTKYSNSKTIRILGEIFGLIWWLLIIPITFVVTMTCMLVDFFDNV